MTVERAATLRLRRERCLTVGVGVSVMPANRQVPRGTTEMASGGVKREVWCPDY
jgi:hypothetical protein